MYKQTWKKDAVGFSQSLCIPSWFNVIGEIVLKDVEIY